LLGEAKPFEPPPGRKERVWLRLQAEPAPRPGRLRLAFAAAVLLAGGVFASAALAEWPGWLARAIGTASPATSIETSPAPVPPRKLARAPSERPAPAEPSPAAEPALPASSEAATGEAFSATVRARRAPRPAAQEDTGPLLEAMRALRVERNPLRARVLLTSYLDHHPRGELAEEALVMLVEAAVDHHDGDASALAGRFFKLYPQSPFKGQVERTLAAYDKEP